MSKFNRAVDLAKASPLAFASLLVGIASSVFVFLQLHPDLIFTDTTPAGGDMGAHVWGPAFLRDHLLPNLRLSGWTPDWYAGFPAFHFYMVMPALAIVLLNAGLPPVIGLVVAAAILTAGLSLASRVDRFGRLIIVLSVLLALGAVSIPYGISFKLVTVLGVVAMPMSGWAMAKLAGATEPIPGAVALGVTVFLFDTNFTIYGGNILSTLAGEFAFSISLALALLAIGVAARGMDRRAHLVAAPVLIALVALNHVIPLIFTVVALFLLIFLDNATPRLWILGLATTMFVAVWLADWEMSRLTMSGLASFTIVVVAITSAEVTVRYRGLWLALVGSISGLLAMFWLLPFYGQSAYFNDMGWERLDDTIPALLTTPMKIALPIAVVGAVFALAMRDRIGMLFTLMAVLSSAGVMNLGQGRLWNARLLPFFYLSVYLVAAVGVGYVIRFVGVALSESFERPHRTWVASALAIGAVVTLVGISIPLRTMPFGVAKADGGYSWLGITNHAASSIPGWSSWNYSGYERKKSYREYYDIITTMEGVGESEGCGRAMWEYSPDLDRYGTPMALMLMPFWTDGCIGSMEGLYFESSSSTPFHFLNQSTLSDSPSRAQRDLPYQSFNLDLGIRQLQTTGVRYYMAQSDAAIEAAATHSDLTEVARSEPWVVYRVAHSELVSALSFEPVVAEGLAEDDPLVENRFDSGWLAAAVQYYNSAEPYSVIPAEDGPSEWQRVELLSQELGQPIEPALVSNIVVDTSRLSFEVDQVGVPVLVKVSYFPNWKASGADGPWRAGPNLMVVVPTDKMVTLSYGRTWLDWLGMLMSLVGLALLVVVSGWEFRRRSRALAPVVADAAPEPVSDLLDLETMEEPSAEGAEDRDPAGLVPDPPQEADNVAGDPVDADPVDADPVEAERAPSGEAPKVDELPTDAMDTLFGPDSDSTSAGQPPTDGI